MPVDLERVEIQYALIIFHLYCIYFSSQVNRAWNGVTLNLQRKTALLGHIQKHTGLQDIQMFTGPFEL